ncbi:MAG: RNA polymerase sigma factor [Bacteroidota bacterium]|nr:RNA polymerase sigma factor [Bacteroidota bacterium]
MNDKELVNAIINQDNIAFKEFVEKYRNLVFKTCIGFVHNEADAEDLSQEVFIEVLRSINKFRVESKISTWLYRISVNKSLNFIRSNKKHKHVQSFESTFNAVSNESDITDNIQADGIIEEKERAKVLSTAIDSLSKNQKIAFTLNKYRDMSYNEISEIMDLSLSSVESLLFRAKKKLQKKLIHYYRGGL